MDKEKLNKEIGERLKEIQKKLGFKNYQEFAKSLNVSLDTIRKYASGRIAIPVHVLHMLAGKFSVNLNYLILGKGEMFDTKEKMQELEKEYYIRKAIKKAVENNQEDALLLFCRAFLREPYAASQILDFIAEILEAEIIVSPKKDENAL